MPGRQEEGETKGTHERKERIRKRGNGHSTKGKRALKLSTEGGGKSKTSGDITK